jgi:hypothetical protein
MTVPPWGVGAWQSACHQAGTRYNRGMTKTTAVQAPDLWATVPTGHAVAQEQFRIGQHSERAVMSVDARREAWSRFAVPAFLMGLCVVGSLTLTIASRMAMPAPWPQSVTTVASSDVGGWRYVYRWAEGIEPGADYPYGGKIYSLPKTSEFRILLVHLRAEHISGTYRLPYVQEFWLDGGGSRSIAVGTLTALAASNLDVRAEAQTDAELIEGNLVLIFRIPLDASMPRGLDGLHIPGSRKVIYLGGRSY